MLINKLKKFVLAGLTSMCVVSAGTLSYAATVNMQLFYDGASYNYSAEEVKIKVNGEEITNLDVPPVILNSRTMVPARAIFEKMGGDITWNAETREVYIIKDNDVVVLRIDSDTGNANGLDFKMDTPAKIINDRTMIPVRAAAEALGCTVGWDESTRLITINEKDYADPTVPDTPSNNNNNNSNNSTQEGGTTSNTITGGTGVAGSTISVTGVSLPQSETASQVFTINTSGAISKFESFMLDSNRIVVDIYGANMNISNSNITATNSTIVKSIRSAQNQTSPNRIARVVLDLSSNVGYTASLGSDKSSIIVSFERNEITDLTARSNGSSDVIRIYGNSTPAITVSKSVTPFMLTVDIPNASNELDSVYDADGLTFISSISSQSTGSNTTRIMLEAVRDIDYSVTQYDGYTEIVIVKSTVENVVYDASANTLILKNIDDLTEDDFTITDDYRNGKYIINLNGNYRSTYGYGTIGAGDSFVSTITLDNNSNGDTEFTVNENSLLVARISVDSSEVRIKFVSPKSVYDKIVVIDAGHGGTDPGTSGNGLTEKTMNLDIANRVYSLLENDSSIKVYTTRIDDSYPTNINRAKMANQAADLFVSIHQNAATNNTVPNGTEVLYTPHSTDVNGKLTSKIAAQFMLNYVLNALGTENRGIKDRPDLIVLNQTTVPAILIETVFLSNEKDAAIIGSEENRQAVAEAIYSAIVDMLNQYTYR